MHDEDRLNRFKTPHEPHPEWMYGDKWSDEEMSKIIASVTPVGVVIRDDEIISPHDLYFFDGNGDVHKVSDDTA